MDKKQLMKAISDKIGRDKAIEMVMQAYNTELLTTSVGRIEANRPIGGPQRRDHLADALERVWEVCQLAP
ncbi:MAG: hypothetical protein JWM88_1650 [Verrucomicrobia bacterium]|nr:hypothetical protein [Verrucomicrobiota bacterium]